MRPVVLKPAALKVGDTVGVVAPASPVHRDRLKAGIRKLEDAGFEVIEAPHLYAATGYLAGSDKERASDLMLMFEDPSVKAVMCARGGYGCLRILPLLDYDLIRKKPKIFLGFSDITALHLAIHRMAGLVTFHGPGVEAFATGDEDFNFMMALRVLSWDVGVKWAAADAEENADAEGTLRRVNAGDRWNGVKFHRFKAVVPGKASGRLLGGNLSLLVAMLGTPYEPDTRGAILFVEDVGEKPYKIDRMLHSLKLAGKLDDVVGFIAGETKPPQPPEAATEAEPEVTVEDVYTEIFSSLGKPCGIGLECGHGYRRVTLPEGVTATLDVGQKEAVLYLDEAPVSGGMLTYLPSR